MRFTLILTLTLIVALAIALFAAQNPAFVVVQFFHWRTETSMAVVVVASVAVGALLHAVVSALRHLLRGIRHREALRQIEELEYELDQFKKSNDQLRQQVKTLRHQLEDGAAAGDEESPDARKEDDSS